MPKHVLDSAVRPAEIVDQSFDVERRGFDRQQVRAYLNAVADSLHDAQQREADMRTRIAKAVRRAETAEQALRDMSATDGDDSRKVGEDIASVLDAARAAGEQRLAAAEKSAQQMLENAKVDAARIRREAEGIRASRQADADAEVRGILADARAEATAMVAHARERLVQARDEGDTLVQEAVEARAQILEDMDRRRRHARAQVERLRVGRDRLLRSYDVVRRTLEETTVELKSSLQEAKVRGDSASRAISSEAPASREQLEAELLDAKLIGRVKITERVPVEPASDDVDAGGTALDRALRSPALPRKLDPPQVPAVDQRDDAAPISPRPRVSDVMKRGTGPKAPTVAPTLSPTPEGESGAVLDPIAAMIAAAEEKKARAAAGQLESTEVELDPVIEPLDDELAGLEDDDLDVVEPGDDIESVTALPVGGDVADDLSGDVAQVDGVVEPGDDIESVTALPVPSDDDSTPPFPGIEAQRDAVIADAAKEFEAHLKRALADEQDELLAGIRAANKQSVALTAMVGDVDSHVNRYVAAINEIAAVTYGAGAALIDAQAPEGHLPAGAVEELLAADVVMPIRAQLQSLDGLDVAAADMHEDPLRALYLQRKTDHLGFAASRLANLLCVAGLCDALPDEASLPWSHAAK